jgi:glycerol-3-phosphate dehydrogenase
MLPEDTNALPVIEGDASVRFSHLGYVAEKEHARDLGDMLYARTGLGYRHRLGDGVIEKAAEAVSAHLGCSESEVRRQIDAARIRRDRLYQPSPHAD